MATTKRLLVLDFDGVIHSYKSGWQGASVIPDPPVPGAFEFILEAVKHFDVAIYSSRSGQEGGKQAMLEWLGYWSVIELPHDTNLGFLGNIQWPTEKPPAFLTIDDRAMLFTGQWPDMDDLKNFKPWYYQA